MSAPVFVVEPALLAGAGPGTRVSVEGDEARHALRVRRLAPGEPVDLVDGLGRRARAVVAPHDDSHDDSHDDLRHERHRLQVEVLSVVDEPSPTPRVVVVQAIPKGDRAELAVELMTEVGVDVVVPWAAARCVAVWRGEKERRGPERWRAAAREAGKQSRRARFPEVRDLARASDVVGLVGAADVALVLHESAADGIDAVELPDGGDIVLVVGPEGGLTEDEVHAVTAAGARAVRLGPTVLRSSTAGCVAAAVILARTGRWAIAAPTIDA